MNDKNPIPNSKRKNIIRGGHCLFILFVLLGVFWLFKVQYINPAAQSFSWEDIRESDSGIEPGEYTFSPESGQLSQTFTSSKDIFWGVRLQFEKDKEEQKGTILIKIENNQGDEVYRDSLPLSEIPSKGPYQIVFNHIERDAEGQMFRLLIRVADMEERDVLKILMDKGEKYEKGTLEDEKGSLEGNINIKQIYGQNSHLNKLFYILFIAFTILVYVSYYFLFIKRIKIEKLFLPIILIIGFVYVFLMSPGVIPDEQVHYISAYANANAVLRAGNESGETVALREEDYDYYYKKTSNVPNVFAYKDLVEEFGEKASRTEIKDTGVSSVGVASFMYYGGTIGIIIGRILGFNALTVFYLGRITNLLLFCGMMYWAFRKLPFYKVSLFAICLLPMTTQLMGSYSYDPIIIGLSLMLIAAVLDYGYGSYTRIEGARFSSQEIKKMIQIAAICALLGLCKGGAYLPLCALILLIPIERFPTKKSWRIFIGSTLFGVLLVFILGGLKRLTSAVNVGEHIVSWTGEKGYTISWVFEHPLGFMKILGATIYAQGDHYIDSVIGKSLGYFNIPILGWIVLGFMFVFLLSTIYVQREKEAVIVSDHQKLGIITCIFLNVGIIMASLFFSWTPVSSGVILGVQGRYFIPLLFPFLLCMKNRTLILRRSIDRQLIFLLIWLQILTVLNIWITPLSTLIG